MMMMMMMLMLMVMVMMMMMIDDDDDDNDDEDDEDDLLDDLVPPGLENAACRRPRLPWSLPLPPVCGCSYAVARASWRLTGQTTPET